MVVGILPERDAAEDGGGTAGHRDERESAACRHAQSGAVAKVGNRALAERFGEEPHLQGEVATGELFRCVALFFNRVLPRHSTVHVGEIDGVELLKCLAPAAGHGHLHFHVLHRRARGAVGYAARHGANALGKAHVGQLVVEDGAVVALVLHDDAVVVVDARQGRLVGIEQIVFVAGDARQRLPCLALLLGAAALHDVGLGQWRPLLVDVPRQLHQTFVAALRGIEAVELRGLADGFQLGGIGVEHLVADDAVDAVVVRVAGIQRLLGVGHARLRVYLVLRVVVLVGGAVLPLEGCLHIGGLKLVDGDFVVAHIDAELMAETLGIGIRGPGEDKAVRLLVYTEVVDGHRARGAHRDAGLRVVALRVDIPEVRHIIDVIDRCRLVGVAGIGVTCLAMRQFGNFRAVTIDHPLEIRVVAGNGRDVPRKENLLVTLIEHAFQVVGFDDRRMDGDGVADNGGRVSEYITIGTAIDGKSLQVGLHDVVAHIEAFRHFARPRQLTSQPVSHLSWQVGLPRVIGHEVLFLAIVDEVGGEGGLFRPLQRLLCEVHMDIEVVAAVTCVHIAGTGTTVEPADDPCLRVAVIFTAAD